MENPLIYSGVSSYTMEFLSIFSFFQDCFCYCLRLRSRNFVQWFIHGDGDSWKMLFRVSFPYFPPHKYRRVFWFLELSYVELQKKFRNSWLKFKDVSERVRGGGEVNLESHDIRNSLYSMEVKQRFEISNVGILVGKLVFQSLSVSWNVKQKHYISI